MRLLISQVLKKTNVLIVFLSLLTPLAYGHLIKGLGFDLKTILILASVPLFFVSVLNTEIVILGMITLLFFNFGISIFRIAVIASIPLFLSYMVTRRKSCAEYVKNPLIIPFSIYFLSILPSLINSTDIYKTMLYSFNLISMAVTAYCVGEYIDRYCVFKRISVVFIVLVVMNGLHVIYEAALTGARVFGFMGVVFVDFVCVAIIILCVRALYFNRRYLLPHIVLVTILLVALLGTQTRNTILSLVATIGIMTLFLLKNASEFSMHRKKLIVTLSIIASVFLGGLVIALLTAPQMLGRFTELFTKEQISISTPGDFGQSSLITRLLIWYTSLNAFLQHPIVGIGVFSFPFQSQLYNTLPNALYKLFVQDLTPHVTYLAVITETGIVGLIGFAVLLISILRLSIRSVRLSITKEQRYYSFGILAMHTYVTFSMTMTDAWLWGRCGMLWALITGASIANFYIVNKNRSTVES